MTTIRLTEREQEVVELVCRDLSAKEIAARLAISPRTVENHIRSVAMRIPPSADVRGAGARSIRRHFRGGAVAAA